VNFQTFEIENLITKLAKKAEYQLANTKNYGSQFSMLKKLELNYEDN
jgi:sialic acid synthase SpsE